MQQQDRAIAAIMRIKLKNSLILKKFLVSIIFLPLSFTNTYSIFQIDKVIQNKLSYNKVELSQDIILSEKIKVQIAEQISSTGGQCVEFIQRFIGQLNDCININCYKFDFQGNAIDIKPNSNEPKIGNVVLLNDSKKGHAAIIADIIDENLILLESNYHGDEKIEYGRIIEMNNIKIRGYYDFNILKEFEAIVTGYSSTIDQTDDTPFITASGKEVKDGILACPRKYPFESKFEIDGKEYICEDRLHIRYDDRFDIWFSTREQAKAFGTSIKNIKLLNN